MLLPVITMLSGERSAYGADSGLLCAQEPTLDRDFRILWHWGFKPDYAVFAKSDINFIKDGRSRCGKATPLAPGPQAG